MLQFSMMDYYFYFHYYNVNKFWLTTFMKIQLRTRITINKEIFKCFSDRKEKLSKSKSWVYFHIEGKYDKQYISISLRFLVKSFNRKKKSVFRNVTH